MKDRTIFNIIIPLGLAFLLVSLLVLSSLNLHNLISSPLSLSEPVLFAMIIMLFITIPVLLILTKIFICLASSRKRWKFKTFISNTSVNWLERSVYKGMILSITCRLFMP